MWELKDLGLEGKITWDIARQAVIYKCGSRICDLYLTEKLIIATANPSSLLNKRSESSVVKRLQNPARKASPVSRQGQTFDTPLI